MATTACQSKRFASASGAGKATVYRRWASKLALSIDVIAAHGASTEPIDTGSLDNDLQLLIVALSNPRSQELQYLGASICSAMTREPELLKAFKSHISEPYFTLIVDIILHARRRGEIGRHVDVNVAASLIPSLLIHHAIITGQSPGRPYAERLVRTVLIPVIGCTTTIANLDRR